MTVRDVSFPPSRSTVSARRGIATVSMSCRSVATDCSSRLSIVGGPSCGKNDGGRGAGGARLEGMLGVVGGSCGGCDGCEPEGAGAGGSGIDPGGVGGCDCEGGCGCDDVPTRGLGGVGWVGGRGRR